jgi:hypothetical protein
MFFRSSLSALRVTIFLLAHFVMAQTSRADSFNQIAEASRHLAEAGKWDEAKQALEARLAETKDSIEAARLKAELAHYTTDRNIYFHKDESLVLAALEEARAAVQATGDKQNCTWTRARLQKPESWQSKAEQELKHLAIPAVPQKQRIFCGNSGRLTNCG